MNKENQLFSSHSNAFPSLKRNAKILLFFSVLCLFGFGTSCGIEKKKSATELKGQGETTLSDDETDSEKDEESESTLKVILPGNTVLSMVQIPAGVFTMGSPESELGHDSDEVCHQVTLTRDFWLGKYEVTQSQYEAVMGINPSQFKGKNHPVENISWDAAKEFCEKLNNLPCGEIPIGYRFDLPTEAQWEYACRAGTATGLNSGKDLTSETEACPNLDVVGWYNKNASGTPHPVGKKKANAWGLYDMHGNVWEWCRDVKSAYRGDETDPEGPAGGSVRVLRGASWLSSVRICRSAYRISILPKNHSSDIGFRIALVPIP